MSFDFYYDSGAVTKYERYAFYIDTNRLTINKSSISLDSVSSYNTPPTNYSNMFLFRSNSVGKAYNNWFNSSYYRIDNLSYFIKNIEHRSTNISSYYLSASQTVAGTQIGAFLKEDYITLTTTMEKEYYDNWYFSVYYTGNPPLTSSHSLRFRVHFHKNAIVFYLPYHKRIESYKTIYTYKVYVLPYKDTRIPTNCCILVLCYPNKYKKA